MPHKECTPEQDRECGRIVTNIVQLKKEWLEQRAKIENLKQEIARAKSQLRGAELTKPSAVPSTPRPRRRRDKRRLHELSEGLSVTDAINQSNARARAEQEIAQLEADIRDLEERLKRGEDSQKSKLAVIEVSQRRYVALDCAACHYSTEALNRVF